MSLNTNPILVPVRNNLHLTRKAIKTFKEQDIKGGVEVLVIDNASNDGTPEWMKTQKDLGYMRFDPPLSVAASWNKGLRHVFAEGAEYALVCNNDIELRPDTYRWLVADGGGFVTAVGTRDAEKIKPNPNIMMSVAKIGIEFGQAVSFGEIGPIEPYYNRPNPYATRPHPDFSCFLIRREVYEKVGPFDENFLIAFVEDQDYHVRLHEAKVQAHCIDLPFLHHGSMTIKNSDKLEIRKIQEQADKNRAYFKKKHGMAAASPEYYAFFGSGAPESL